MRWVTLSIFADSKILISRTQSFSSLSDLDFCSSAHCKLGNEAFQSFVLLKFFVGILAKE